MTLEQLIALLTGRFSGVRKDGLAQLAKSLLLQVTTEEEAQALVEKLSEQQVTDFVKDWRKEVDSEVNKGIDTYKKKNPAPEKKEEKDGESDPPKPADPADIATIVSQAVAAQLKPLQEELSSYKAADVNKQRRATLESKLKDAPEKFRSKILKDYDRMNFESDEVFNEYLTETETDLTEFNQELANQGLGKFPKPGQGGSGKTDEIPPEVAAYIKSKEPESTSNLGGKEV